MATREIPEASPHGELRELFPDVFMVTGSVTMKMPIPMRFSRNMTVIRQGESLTLVGSMRLGDAGLAKLDGLGKVEHVIRLAGFHGMDDPFYKDRYDAKVWVVKGQRYIAGFDAKKKGAVPYFTADVEMDDTTELPIAGAQLFVFKSARPPEGLLLLEREGGILVAGDSLQNWPRTDTYFNWPAKLMMKAMGFIKPHNVGPGWLKGAKPDVAEVRSVLDLDFDHLLPVHGDEVIGKAKAAYRPAIDGLA